jgi:Set1/Ash2 histone methyltransferase complex subunit ASH2
MFILKDIIPFIDKNWEALTSAPRRVKSTWHATISRSMVSKLQWLSLIIIYSIQ